MNVNDTSETKQGVNTGPDIALIRIFDAGDFYSIYGVVTLIIVLLLLWYFVKSNMEGDEIEGLSGTYSLIDMSDLFEEKDWACLYCGQIHSVKAQCQAFTDKTSVSNKMEGLQSNARRLREGLNKPDGDEFGDFGIMGLSGAMTAPMSVPLTPDGQNPNYKLQTGTYGDVPVVFYSEQDLPYSQEWHMPNRLYVPNTRTVFRKTITPYEREYWEQSGEI